MSLVFYYAPMSTASITELVIEELGIPCEKVRIDFSKGDTKKPDYVKLNPNAKVPLVVHDGTPIWESAALTMYLGELFGVEKKLYPAPGPRRGEAMKWIVWTNVTIGDAVGRWTRNTMSWIPEEQHNAKAAEAARKDIDNCLRILDESLEGKQYLVGDYTLADTHLCSFSDWLRHMQIDMSPYKNVTAWADRCRDRPAFKKLMELGAALGFRPGRYELAEGAGSYQRRCAVRFASADSRRRAEPDSGCESEETSPSASNR